MTVFSLHALMADEPDEIFEKFRKRICLVTYYKNVSSQSQIGSYIKIEQERIGLIVSSDGLVMVNSDIYPLSLDLVSGDGVSFSSGEPSDFKVKLHDGKELVAEFLGKDDQAQVAFVRIAEDSDRSFPHVSFDKNPQVRVGEQVFLMELLSDSYQHQPLFTEMRINAIVETPRRKYLVKNEVTALSAGGLVVNKDGVPIGITLRSEPDFSFLPSGEFDDFQRDFLEIAPPANFRGLIANPPQLQRSVVSNKAWLGVGMQALTPELAAHWGIKSSGGVIVNRVFPDSPAQQAGLSVRDVITSFGGQALGISRDEDLNQMREYITRRSPKDAVTIEVYRNGRRMLQEVTLQSAPRAVDLAEKMQFSELGLEVRELTRDVLYNYHLPLDTGGVYVYQVDRAAPAGLGGLEAGSIITHVNGHPVASLAGFAGQMELALKRVPQWIQLQVQMRRTTDFVFVELK